MTFEKWMRIYQIIYADIYMIFFLRVEMWLAQQLTIKIKTGENGKCNIHKFEDEGKT